MAWAALAATVLTTAMSVEQSKQVQKNEEAGVLAQAKRAQAAAKEAEAAGQLKANAARRRADIMASRALAVAAASGAGTSGIENLMSGIAEEGERAAGAEEYQSIETSKSITDQSAIAKNAMKNRAEQMKVDRASTVVSGIGQSASIYSKYGGGFKSDSGSDDDRDYRSALQTAASQYQYD